MEKGGAVIQVIDYRIQDRIMKKLQNLDMDTEFNTGQTEHTMKDNGLLIKLKAMEHFGTLKAIYTKESLEMIWRMDMENTLILI